MIRQESVSRIEALLVLSGPLSGDTVEDLHRRLTGLLSGRFLTITLDLSQAPTLNSAAISKILLFNKKLAEKGKTLQIQGCSEGVYRIFKALRLDKLIRIAM